MIQRIALSEIKENPDNPRVMRNEKFKGLIKSIEEFPEMLEIRPIILNADMMILGGNMRYAACKALDLKEVPVIIANNLTQEQQDQFLIKDNVNFGEWDWDILANEWENKTLNLWGMDVWVPEYQEEFVPKTEPLKASRQMTQEELDDEAVKMSGEMNKGTERKFMACTCPNCQEKFSVEQ